MTPDGSTEPNARQQAAFEARWEALIDGMSEDQLRSLIDPKVREPLMREVWLATKVADAIWEQLPAGLKASPGGLPPDQERLGAVEADEPQEPHTSTRDGGDELNPREVAAFRARLDAMGIDQIQSLKADPDAMQALAVEAQLEVALEDADDDQLLAASNSLAEGLNGPLFSDAEWALIFAQPSTRHLASDARARAQFEYAMRQDPAKLRSMSRAMADLRADNNSVLSPMAKQWIWRIAIGLALGLVVIALNQG